VTQLIRRKAALQHFGFTDDELKTLPQWAWGIVRKQDGAVVLFVHDYDIMRHASESFRVNLINEDDRRANNSGGKARLTHIDHWRGGSPTWAIVVVTQKDPAGGEFTLIEEGRLFRVIGLLRPNMMTIDAVIRKEDWNSTPLKHAKAAP
jgi:hypothetical protein